LLAPRSYGVRLIRLELRSCQAMRNVSAR
jgi:hypothetical protein